MKPAEPEILITIIGSDGQPIVVIDNFFADAEALRVAAQASIFEHASNLYPGIRAPLPDDYWSEKQIRICESVIAHAFNLSGSINLIDSSFSIVTTAPDELSIGQRLPHIDALSPRHIALVHYLTHDFTEGTAFYRHRSTGLQAITEHSRQAYFCDLEEELRLHGPPSSSYIQGNTQLFEKIFEVEAKFNRALLYKGQQLHSGAIGALTNLSADPSKGRLTVTAFMMLI